MGATEWLTEKEQQAIASELYNTLNDDTVDRSFKILATIRYDPNLTEKTPQTVSEISEDNFFLLEEHVRRLDFTSNYFAQHFKDAKTLDFSKQTLLDNFKQGLKAAGLSLEDSYKVRLLVSLDGEVEVEFHTTPHTNLMAGLQDNYDSSKQYEVYVDSEPIMISPFTSFKTTKRDGYTAARNRKLAQKSPREEVLVYNTQGALMEGSITNVAVKDKNLGIWVTPMLSSGCLCGVTRHFLLANNYIKEAPLYVSDLKSGQEVLLFNGIMGVVRGTIV